MKILLTAICMITLLSYCPVIAQKPASIRYFRGGPNLHIFGSEQSSLFVFPALNLTPGLRIIQGRDFALVMTMPISVGYSSDHHGRSFTLEKKSTASIGIYFIMRNK